jgi:hypothetical protein
MRKGNRYFATMLLVLSLSAQPLFALSAVRANGKSKPPAKTHITNAPQRNTGCSLDCEEKYKKCLRGDYNARDKNGRVIRQRSDEACWTLRQNCRYWCRNP